MHSSRTGMSGYHICPPSPASEIALLIEGSAARPLVRPRSLPAGGSK